MSYEITLNDWLPPSDAVAWDRVRLEFSQAEDPYGTWVADDVQNIVVDATPLTPDLIDIPTANFPWVEGYVRAVFLHPDDSESLPSAPVYTMVTFNGGLRGLVPRARRALEGFATAVLTDDQIRDLLADAVAEIIWYAPSWGKTLVATSRDASNIPNDFEITPELSLPEQTVVVSQAALNYYFHKVEGGTIAQAITNEATSWSWQKSATLLADQFKLLREARDAALAVLLVDQYQALETYVSYIAVQDASASRIIEPWVDTAVVGIGQIDYRFG